MIDILIPALAALYGWYVLAYLKPPLVWRLVAVVRRRSSWADHLIGCPWCGGAWVALATTSAWWASCWFATDAGTWLELAVRWFAAAALVGVAGYWLTDRWGDD